jgi:beta-1,4-mannosyl-glycoprotein beta-1,4-N-acetylglucosaminyltransferase
MIYDTFLFFNELELLELRLHELTDVVDRFVLVEATHTFTGKPKPLFFQANRAAFQPFLPKIIHVVAEDLPDSDNAFIREDYQRNCVQRGLSGCAPDDLVLLSDVDEIPRAESVRQAVAAHRFDPGRAAAAWHRLLRPRAVIWTVRNWLKKRHPFVTVFEQQYHAFFLNCVKANGQPWFGTRLVHYRDFTTATDLRRWNGRRIRNGGWHFTYMGGVERIQAKLTSFSHQEYDTPAYTDPTRLAEALRAGRNLILPGMPLRFEAINGSYPAYLRQNLPRFQHWLRAPGQ